MSFLNKLINQSVTEHAADQPAVSLINEKDRYRMTVLPGQNLKYPSFIPLEYPDSYTVNRDLSDPRFQFNYQTFN
jgi:hypothetical protein